MVPNVAENTHMSYHLWDVEHPYYCSEAEYHTGNFNGENWGRYDFDSWGDFYAEWGASDPDMNLVFRWDWHTKEQREKDSGWNEYTDEDKAEEEALGYRPPDYDLLEIFFVLQRKGLFVPCHIRVTDEDEPEVRAWLTERAKTISAIWKPIL